MRQPRRTRLFLAGTALSHLLTSHLRRLERTLGGDTEHHRAHARPHERLPIAIIEAYAGIGTFMAAFVHLGGRAHSASEKKNVKHPVLRARNPAMILREFADEPAPLPDERYVLVCAGLQCQPFAPGGSRLAGNDPRAVDVTDTIPAIVEGLGDRYVSVDIEEHEDLLLRGRAVLEQLVINMRALTYPMELSPPTPEGMSPHLCNGPLWRRRIALRFEQRRELARLGPAPPLSLQLVGPKTIAELVPTPPARCAFLEGTLTHVQHAPSRSIPTVAATLAYGGPTRPVGAGSRVSLKDREGVFVVLHLDAAFGTLTLLHDVPGNTYRKGLGRIPISNVKEHLVFNIDVLSMHGIARSFTTMPVPPLGCAKQAWLWDDGKAPPRAFVPDWRQLLATLDCLPEMLAPYDNEDTFRATPGVDSDTRPSIIGDMLSMRLAEPVAHRSVCRSQQSRTARSLDAHLETSEPSFVTYLAGAFWPVQYHNDKSAFVVVTTTDDNGNLMALVSADNLQLPRALVGGSAGSRDSLVAAASKLMSDAEVDIDFDPHAFLTLQRGALLAATVPLPRDVALAPAVGGFARWATLASLSESALYLPVAAAFVRVAGHSQRGMPVPHTSMADGAMSARRVAHRTIPPALTPAAWPMQLHYLEAVDTHFRRGLLSTPKTHRHRARLVAWADCVDTSPNALMPEGLRGLDQSGFDAAAIVHLPFTAEAVIPQRPPPSYPARQSTTHKPRCPSSIVDMPSIIAVATKIQWIVRALDYAKRGLPIPESIRVHLTTLVIAQSHFHPDARALIWDMRRRHADGHFEPLDFAAAPPTHMHGQAYYDELGDDFNDQSLRTQQRDGTLYFADLAYQIVLSPHLLSIADGFDAVEDMLKKRRGLGYLEFVKSEAVITTADAITVVLALGLLPIRITSQGARARTDAPDRPRQVEDLGRTGWDGDDEDGEPVSSVNDAVAYRSVVDGVRKFDKECKPNGVDIATDLCVMQCAGRIFGQPVISGTADASDCFNQFFVHPSELWKTSILWRNILDVARSARYTHILANSFGFGGSPSSGYCQRFLNSMLHRVRHRMDAEEHLIEASGAVTDASQLAYLTARRTLGPGQDRLYCCRAYTDDPYFLAVSVERWIRLISHWHDVVLITGLRMAGAHKHQAGSTILWTGIRVLAAYGALAVPIDKRLRATRQLRSIERQERTTLETAKSVAGLVGHVLPIIGLNKADMNPLYWPHRTFAARSHNHEFTPTSSMAASARNIANALCARAGIAAFMMLDPTPASMTTAIVVMSSDAAKDGTANPGVAGYMHGRSWRVPLRPDDVSGPCQISINALEFVGIYGNVVTFGGDTAGFTTLQLTDSLTSANITVAESAKAPAMELVHNRLRARAEYKRMELTMLIAHIYGPGNVISDAGSRGYFQRVDELCTQLGITHEWVQPHPSVAELLDDLRALARGTLPEVLEPSPPPPAAMPPAAATVTSNASARPQFDPHGNGVRIGESGVPAPCRKRVRNWIAWERDSDSSDVTEAELMARAMADVSAEVTPAQPTAPVPTPPPLAPAPSAVQATSALATPAPASSTALAPLPDDAAPSPAPAPAPASAPAPAPAPAPSQPHTADHDTDDDQVEPAPRLCQTKDCTRPRRVRHGLGRDFPVGAFSWACCSHCARGTHDANGAKVHSAACDALAALLPPAPAPVPTPTPLAHAPSTMHATDALPAPPPRNLRAAGICALAGCSLPVYDSGFDYCTASHASQGGALAPLPAPGRGYAPLPAPAPVVPAGPPAWSPSPLPPASPFQSPPAPTPAPAPAPAPAPSQTHAADHDTDE